MRIISDYHDYYDSVQAYGRDPDLVYFRKNSIESTDPFSDELILEKRIPREIFYSNSYSDSINIIPSLIFFCGRAYLVYRAEISRNGSIVEYKNLISTDQVKEFIDSCFLESLKRSFYGASYGYEWGSCNFTYSNTERSFEAVSKYENDKTFQILKAPCFSCVYIAGYSNIITNPVLKTLGFQSIMDPFSTFQNISMYLSGVIGNTETVVENMSDEVKRDKKGFDSMSFKTYKGTKKPRRRGKK